MSSGSLPQVHEDRTVPVSSALRSTISDRVCDLVTGFAALWTIACHAAVARAGSLNDLLSIFGILLVISAGIGIRRWCRASAAPRESSSSPSPTATPESHALPWRSGAGALLGALVLLWYAASSDVLTLWWASVGLLGFALVSGVVAAPQPEPRVSTGGRRPHEIALWGMGAVCALIVLNFHRVDYDSAFYVSMAVAAADFPSAPLMRDTIHGVEGLAMHMPAHRVHSYEVFVGALSRLTGVPAITLYHVVVPAVVAFLVPLAFARLFRILTPRHWPWSVLAVLVVLVGVGDTAWWYANLSIVRIFHGKSVYMSVFLPLAYAYGLRFGSKPSLRHWLLLAAVQISAVGCSSSALWSVPIASGLAVLCGVRCDRRAIGTLALAVLASAYVVGVGLTLVGDMARVAAAVPPDSVPGVDLAFVFERVLGDGSVRLAAVAALLLAWACRRGGAAQRFAIVVPLGVLLLVLNPYWSDEVSRSVTGPSYWRAMWSLPVPILLALALTAPMQLDRSALMRRGAAIVTLLCLLAFVAFVPESSALSRSNRVRFGGFAETKVPRKWYMVASALSHLAPEGSMVVAPQKVALWVHSFHRHPFVTSSREVYMQRVEAELGREEVDRRMQLSEAVSLHGQDIEPRIRETEGYRRRRQGDDSVRGFREGLERYEIRGVCINEKAPLYAPIRRILAAEGFVLKWRKYGYQVWILPEGRGRSTGSHDPSGGTNPSPLAAVERRFAIQGPEAQSHE